MFAHLWLTLALVVGVITLGIAAHVGFVRGQEFARTAPRPDPTPSVPS